MSPLDRSLEQKYQTAVVFELLFIYAIGGYMFRSDTVPNSTGISKPENDSTRSDSISIPIRKHSTFYRIESKFLNSII